MTTPHKYAEILKNIANGVIMEAKASNNEYDNIEPSELLFRIYKDTADFYDDLRVKKNTIRIGEYDVPEPMREAPEKGTKYYYLEDISEEAIDWFIWDNFNRDNKRLNMGICHSSNEDAEVHLQALLSLTAPKAT